MGRKRQLRLGVDCDGVLRDFGHQFAIFASQQFGVRLRHSDYEDYGFTEVKDAEGNKIISQVWKNPQVGQFIFEQAPPIPGAYTAYRRFVDHPNIDTYIVTSQKKDYIPFTANWLNEHGFDEHIKTFYERNKIKAPVQILIDDKPEHILKFLENGRDGILIDQSYNQHVNLPGSVPRANDLMDAFQIVTNKYRKYV